MTNPSPIANLYELEPLTPWEAEHFRAIARGSGARKLADSGVAPLVAAARGYDTVVDEDDLKRVRKMRKTGRGRPPKQQTDMLERGAAGEDTLVIPWYDLQDVNAAGVDVMPLQFQYRPSTPLIENGKARKYLLEAKGRSTFDMSPSVPHSWLMDAPTILFVEGALKADSTLTAILRTAGVTDAELSQTTGDRRADRLALRALLDRVPSAKRVLVIGLIGVGNWNNVEGLVEIVFHNRTGLIAFDGDVRRNRNVWNQARKLYDFIERKHGIPKLIDLDGPEAVLRMEAVNYVGAERLGMDDFLSRVGSWNDALTCVSEILPDAPVATEDTGYRKGDYRVSEDGTLVEEYAQSALTQELYWDRVIGMGGRVKYVRTLRQPTLTERQTGLIDAEVDGRALRVEVGVEVSWVENGETFTETIIGPGEMLGTSPAEWTPRRFGDRITMPQSVYGHPVFTDLDNKWLKAVKSNRRGEIASEGAWETMGYVPTSSGSPVFIAGNVRIARHATDEQSTLPGVSSRSISAAPRFGVVDTYRDLSLEEYKRQIRDDLRSMYAHWFASGAFAHRKFGAVAWATMFRPTLPTRPSVTLSLFGPPKSGKSYLALAIMGAWQKKGNSWVASLPGGANDTFVATELNVSRTPIWVADDLAAAVDARLAVAQEQKLSDFIRSVFNGQGKGRGSADLEQRAPNNPRAQFIITSENEFQTDSVRQRTLQLEVGARGVFGDDPVAVRTLKTFFTSDLTQARMSAAMIRLWHLHGDYAPLDWTDIVSHVTDDVYESVRRDATEHMLRFGMSHADSTRQGDNAAEFAQVFDIMHTLGHWAGLGAEEDVMQALNVTSPTSLTREIYGLFGDAVESSRNSSPGKLLLRALGNTLAAGRAHLANPDQAGMPPFTTNDIESNRMNERLGWVFDTSRGQDGAWVPRGTRIGQLVEIRRGKATHLAALLDRDTAFNEAKRNNATLIQPGMGATVGWRDVWDQGGISPAAPPRAKQGVTVQITLRSAGSGVPAPGVRNVRGYGVPVNLDALLDVDAFFSDDTDADAHDEVDADGADTSSAA